MRADLDDALSACTARLAAVCIDPSPATERALLDEFREVLRRMDGLAPDGSMHREALLWAFGEITGRLIRQVEGRLTRSSRIDAIDRAAVKATFAETFEDVLEDLEQTLRPTH
jgi:hypothetical protein